MKEFKTTQEAKSLILQQIDGNLENVGFYTYKGNRYIFALGNHKLITFDESGNLSNLPNQELGLNSMPCILSYDNKQYKTIPLGTPQTETPTFFIFSPDKSCLAKSVYGCRRVSEDYQDVSYNYLVIFDKRFKDEAITNCKDDLTNLYGQICPNIQEEYQSAYPIVDLRNNQFLDYKYWKSLNGRALFIDSSKLYILYNNTFHALGLRTYIWNHGGQNNSLIDIDNSKNDLLKIELLSSGNNALSHFESRFRCSNNPYNFACSKEAIIAYRGNDGILVIDRYGNELWNANGSLPYEISGVRDNLIYHISPYKHLCMFNLKGNKILESSIIILGNGDIKTSDWSNLAVSSLNNRHGVININKKSEIVPCVYDNIIIIKFENLPANILEADCNTRIPTDCYHTETNEYFVAFLMNGLSKSCILFSEKECLIPPGQFDDIIPIQYYDSMCESHYKRNQYGIDIYSPICGSKSTYSGWFLLKRESSFYFRFAHTTYKLSSLIDFCHPNECSLYLIVRTSDGIGLLSPLGWIFEPVHRNITRFTTDGSDRFYGSSGFFGRWHVFLVDNDIYKVRINSCNSKLHNEVDAIFKSDGEYKYMSWDCNTCSGIDFSFKRLTDNRKIKLNVSCASLNRLTEEYNTYDSDDNSWGFYYGSKLVYYIDNGLVKTKDSSYGR